MLSLQILYVVRVSPSAIIVSRLVNVKTPPVAYSVPVLLNDQVLRYLVDWVRSKYFPQYIVFVIFLCIEVVMIIIQNVPVSMRSNVQGSDTELFVCLGTNQVYS
jgi:hypothetical protein